MWSRRDRSSRPSGWAPRPHEVVIDRPEGPLATLTLPGQPSRTLALKVRTTSELIAEELRRLDADEMYAIALRAEGTKETARHA